MQKLYTFLLVVCLLFGFDLNAQTVREPDCKNKTFHKLKPWGNGRLSSGTRSITCGADTVEYPEAKSTTLRLLSLNNTSSAQAISQYFDCPQSLIIHGFDFFGFTNSTFQLNVEAALYLAGPDSIPMGSPVATVTVTVDSSLGTTSMPLIRNQAFFTSPVTINQAYCLVVTNNSPQNLSLLHNDWDSNDGAGEYLLSGQFPTGNWSRGYTMNVSGNPVDADVIYHPYVEYDITASFSADSTCLTGFDTVNFTNLSSPVVTNRMYNAVAFAGSPSSSFNWDFGDGSSSFFAVSPSHIYPGAGPYSPSVVISMGNWTTAICRDTFQMTIGTPGTPIANFSNSIIGKSVDFIDISSGGYSWQWDFGDGNSSSMRNPTHAYANNGTYTVELIVNNSCGSDTTQDTVTINCTQPAPVAAFGWSKSGFQVSFSDSSSDATAWSWDFGDGTGTSTNQNPNYVYSNSGWYNVILIVSNLCGSDTLQDSVFAGFVGIESDNPLGGIKLYPNPMSDQLNVQIPSGLPSEVSLSLFSTSGKLVKQVRDLAAGTTHFDVSALPKGMYLLEISSDQGKIVRKFVKY